MPRKPAKKPAKMPKFPDLTTPVKRLVLIHTKGRYAGMSRIIGMTPEVAELVAKEGLPSFMPQFLSGCSLIRVANGTAYYREITPPPPTGKLGQFHPEQR